MLEAAWDDERGYSYPNPTVYPHQWLWDSCFHSIAWAALGDQRAVKELEAVFEGQLASGFVPHMRYAEPSQYRGPLDDRSGYTQPPVYGHALAVGVRSGLAVPDALIARVGGAYDYLWRERRTQDGLLRIVHPWEAGADDSPRWDGWIGSTEWNRELWTGFDLELVGLTAFEETGEATGNERFEAAPAAFNAIAAHGMRELASVGGDQRWRERADEVSAAIDDRLWEDDEGLWSDRAVVGPDDSVGVPTLDGALPALSTKRRAGKPGARPAGQPRSIRRSLWAGLRGTRPSHLPARSVLARSCLAPAQPSCPGRSAALGPSRARRGHCGDDAARCDRLRVLRAVGSGDRRSPRCGPTNVGGAGRR